MAFDAVLAGLVEAGLVPKRGIQRPDSTHVLGLVAQRMRQRKQKGSPRGRKEVCDAFWVEMAGRSTRIGMTRATKR